MITLTVRVTHQDLATIIFRRLLIDTFHTQSAKLGHPTLISKPLPHKNGQLGITYTQHKENPGFPTYRLSPVYLHEIERPFQQVRM